SVWTIRIRSCRTPSVGVSYSDEHPGSSWITALAFSKDGKRLASGAAFNTDDSPDMPRGDGSVRIWDWDPASNTITGGLNQYYVMEQTIKSLAFSPDGELLAAASESGDIVLLNVIDLSFFHTVPLHTFEIDSEFPVPVSEIAFSLNGDLLVAGDHRGHINIWSMDDFSLVSSLKHDGEIWGVRFSPDGTKLITASGDQTIRIWGILPEDSNL
ncbi:MAG: hypothetical protein JSW42_01550, partial [Chloroflexota bacterium]